LEFKPTILVVTAKSMIVYTEYHILKFHSIVFSKTILLLHDVGKLRNIYIVYNFFSFTSFFTYISDN
jgi:hypothetical protein